MASKDTGFHPSDADWTRGRAQAVADAEAIARRQIGMTRKVVLAAAEAGEDALAEAGSEARIALAGMVRPDNAINLLDAALVAYEARRKG